MIGVTDYIIGIGFLASLIFIVDWHLSGKHTLGEYGDYRGLSGALLVVLFYVTAALMSIAILWFVCFRIICGW